MTAVPEIHPLLEQSYWLSQIVLAVVGTLAVIVAAFAATYAYKQVQAFRLFALLSYIEDIHVREARRTVLLDIRNSNAKDWWTDPRLDKAASTVAAAYANLGHVIRFERHWRRNDRVGRFFLKNWADSIGPTHDTLVPYLIYRRETQPAAYRSIQLAGERGFRISKHKGKNERIGY